MLETTHLDEGPKTWRAGPADLTRVDVGEVDPTLLLSLPGAAEEQHLFAACPSGRMEPEAFDALVSSIKSEGMHHPVTVHVEIDGTVVITEGNHRLRAAAQADAMARVEIKYFGNSQRNVELCNDLLMLTSQRGSGHV